MKTIYQDLCHCLKIWPVFRGVCAFALAVSFVEMLVLALIHQFAGITPTVKSFNLLVSHWQLPFSISRQWDILALPIFIFFSYKNECRRENCYFDMYADEYYGEKIMDLIQIALCGALFGCVIFGILYAIPAFVVTYVLWIIISVGLLCIEGVISLFRGWGRGMSVPN